MQHAVTPTATAMTLKPETGASELRSKIIREQPILGKLLSQTSVRSRSSVSILFRHLNLASDFFNDGMSEIQSSVLTIAAVCLAQCHHTYGVNDLVDKQAIYFLNSNYLLILIFVENEPQSLFQMRSTRNTYLFS